MHFLLEQGESSDNFNWGVRRRLLSDERDESHGLEKSPPQQARKSDNHQTSKPVNIALLNNSLFPHGTAPRNQSVRAVLPVRTELSRPKVVGR